MKETKEDSSKDVAHSIKTPTPPQVMDPSKTPDDNKKTEAKKGKAENSFKKKVTSDQNKLTPNDEL